MKSMIASIRKNRITSAHNGELSIAMLRALVCSDTPLATMLARGTRSDVFLCRDRHSDIICRLTCSAVVISALKHAHRVATILVPEPYIKWHPRVKAHAAIVRITTVAPNVRGELLLIDSEAHVIYMASRAVPCELRVIVGKARSAGDADCGTVSGKAVRLREPQFLAMLVVKAGKKESAFFSDVGNGKVRLITNVQALDAKPSVTTVAIRSLDPLEPYALALVDPDATQLVLAVGEDRRRRVLLVRLDKSHTSGATIRGMEWPHLLSVGSLAACDGMLYAANGSNVLTVDLRSRKQAAPLPIALHACVGDPPFAPFVDAQGLAVASDIDDDSLHIVYVADAGANLIRMLTVEGTSVCHVAIFGTGAPATLPGPVGGSSGWPRQPGAVAFHEPVGLAVQHGVLFVACYGGPVQGSVVAVSPTAFGMQLLQALGDLYDAFGFILPSATPAQRAARHPPLRVALDTFRRCMAFLNDTCRAHSEWLSGHKGLKGPDGSFYWHTVKGGLITLASCCDIMRELEAGTVTNAERMTLYALVDEGPVENGFGNWVMQSTTDMPTAQAFADALPGIQRHTICKLGYTLWSQHTSVRQHYAEAQASTVSAPAMLACAERAFYAQHPQCVVASTAGDKERLRQEKECARRFARIAEAQRTGSVRSCFKGRVGFGPTILAAAIAPAEGAGAPLRRFPSYRERVQALPGSTGEGASQSLLSRAICSYLAGDIVFLLAGAKDAFWQGHNDDDDSYDGSGTRAEALWWPVQLTRSIKKAQSGANCRLHGFWLDTLPADELDEGNPQTEDRCFALLSGAEIIPLPRLCNLLKDPATSEPFVVTSDALPSSWSSAEGQVYVISAEWVEKLDAAAEAVHGAVDLASSSDSEEANADDQSDESDADAGGAHIERERTSEHREERNAMRQQNLREAFGAPGASAAQPEPIAQRLMRLRQIEATLAAHRQQWLQEHPHPLAMMSLGDWPMSLRRQLKEAQRLSRELQAEGLEMCVRMDVADL